MLQPGILPTPPTCARFVTLRLLPDADPRVALKALAAAWDENLVVGFGRQLVVKLGCEVLGLRDFPALVGAGVTVPSTPAALWLWVKGSDPGEVLTRSHELQALLAPAFAVEKNTTSFKYREGRDLTGYVDGTENPEDRAAEVAGSPLEMAGMAGSSFVAVQHWVHDLDRFGSFDQARKDNTIGRRQSDNEEFDEAPANAHVKRTAQESFSPEAFVLRRSMPYSDGAERGLVFVAFGATLDAYEAQLRRMVGEEDGIVDALFDFSRPITGNYFWCPPAGPEGLDLSLLGL